MKILIVSMYFHDNGLNCFSSKDFHYKGIVQSFDTIREYLTALKNKYALSKESMYSYSDDKIFVITVSFKQISYIERQSFNILVNSFDSASSQDYAKLLIDEYIEKRNKVNIKTRIKQGYVVCQDFPNCLKELSGNLPKQIILDNLDYLSTGMVFGYLGSSSRMLKHDDWITKLYNSSEDDFKDKISGFMNHSNGRHFMDNICEDTSKEEFLKYFYEYLP